MNSRQVIMGLLIFAVVTIAVFLFLTTIFKLNEGLSVILGLIAGFGAEVLYRKRKNKEN